MHTVTIEYTVVDAADEINLISELVKLEKTTGYRYNVIKVDPPQITINHNPPYDKLTTRRSKTKVRAKHRAH